MSVKRLTASEVPSPIRLPKLTALPSSGRSASSPNRSRSRARRAFSSARMASRSRSLKGTIRTVPIVSPAARISSATREASDQPRGRPARVSGLGPRTREQPASVRGSLQSNPAPGRRVPRPDQHEPRSARRGAERRDVARAPAASCHGRRRALGDPPTPAVSRAVRTSPTARRPPNRLQPDARLANQHGANRSAQRETGRAPRLLPQLRARTRDRPGAAVRHPRPGHPQLPWRAPGRSAAALRRSSSISPPYWTGRPPRSTLDSNDGEPAGDGARLTAV
jgi:hypothetical protein